MAFFSSPIFLKHWAISTVRSFLSGLPLKEVHTPLLSKSSGFEPFIDAIRVVSSERPEEKYYLSTSPEFGLKKMLALFFHEVGSEEKGIFEIAHSFRDEKKSPLHHLEFTMAEWYKTSSHYIDFIKEINQLIQYLFVKYEKERKVNPSLKLSLDLENSLKYKEYKEIEKCAHIYPVKELFKKILDTPILANTNGAEYQKIAIETGLTESALVSYRPDSFYEEEWLKAQLFQLIFDSLIMPNMKKDIWHIYDFPPFLRGMASLNDEGWSERVECYINGIEVSNGYQELSSPDELKNLWEYNNEIRKIENKPPHKLDEILIELTPKMQGVAGISVGMERLLIALGFVNHTKAFLIYKVLLIFT